MNNLMLMIPLITHTLIGLYFVFFGIWNIYHWRPTMEIMVQKNFPHPWLFLSVGILWETVLGIMIVLNLYVMLAALLLIPFTVISVCLFHPFWQYRGEHRNLNVAIFIMNITVTVSALLLLIFTAAQ